MIQKVNLKYADAFTTKARYIIVMGGRGAGRSFFASQYVLAKLVDTYTYLRCAIMRFIAGDIRNSIYQEILDRIEENDLQEVVTAKALSFHYYRNMVKGIGFRKSSGDQKSKLKSIAAYNVVVIEEADEVSEEDFMQLDDSLRTVAADIKVVLLLNPPDKRHWIVRRWFNLVESGVPGFYKLELKKEMDDTLFIHTTYEDNIANISTSTQSNYERYKQTRPDYYWNMIKGLVSEGLRGRIFTTWKPITDAEFDELPYDSEFGLDFGFTNDPCALEEVKQHNNKVWVREWIYETGLTNTALSQKMDDLGVPRDKLIVADSAEPKSIQELIDLGWNVVPAVKGADSVRNGVNQMLGMEVSYTEKSTGISDETQGYIWKLDKNKEPTNEPEDKNNHGIDAVRYRLTRVVEFIGFA